MLIERIKRVIRTTTKRLLKDPTITALSQNWRIAPAEQLEMHRTFIKKNYIHPQWYWETAAGLADLENLATGRLNADRVTYVPWINSFLPLSSATILEVGAGTGSGIVALAEQGARVTGVDILEEGIAVAKDKCRRFGIEAELFALNFLDYTPSYKQRFDAVIFFASMEHMLLEERLKAIPRAWEMIRPGGFLIMVEAPNRLWHFDAHTSYLPFFHWLPRELALEYMRFSPRTDVAKLLFPPSEATLLELQRWGMGVSYHEFEVALGSQLRTDVRHDLEGFYRERRPLKYIGWQFRRPSKYMRFLRASAPDVHEAWFAEILNLAIQRPSES